MKKYLVRAGLSPFDNFSEHEIMQTPKILGNNSGNMLYAYSVWRSLMTEDTELVPTYYRTDYTDEELDQINEEYDGFIIPLANAFRSNFQKEMRALTRMVKYLTIPSYVIGVGVNFPFEPDFSVENDFDDTVREFISAVLEKSAKIGVRGELTQEYLQHLGFAPERQIQVIGCPSMYTFGSDLQIRSEIITRDSRVAYNHTTATTDLIEEFILRSAKEFKNPPLVFQTRKEFEFIYSGSSYMYHTERPFPCKSVSDSNYDSLRFFINEPSWLDFMKDQQFVFGARLHGNISATLAGTPSLLIQKDARTRELSEYHQLTSVPMDQITEETSIFDLIEQADFQSPLKVQARNFDRYVDFLNANELDHIYKNDKNPKDTAFDRRIDSIDFHGPVCGITTVPPTEVAKRLELFHDARNTKLEKAETTAAERKETIAELKAAQKAKNAEHKAKIKDKNAEIKELKRQLNEANRTLTNRVIRKTKKVLGINKK